jgi:hypothetical protein
MTGIATQTEMINFIRFKSWSPIKSDKSFTMFMGKSTTPRTMGVCETSKDSNQVWNLSLRDLFKGCNTDPTNNAHIRGFTKGSSIMNKAQVAAQHKNNKRRATAL